MVQAGTGTGKTLAYLVPAILSGKRIVVATATKALQDQLVGKDLPFLAAHLERPFTYSSLKGRANYLCLQRAKEVLGGDEQLAISGVDPLADRAPRSELLRLIEWGTETETGDRADLAFEPSSNAWAALSVSARECPGVSRCAIGEACFAERARADAAEADVIVVNSYLYGMHLATDGAVLPEHDVVVFDEAHQLEEVISATAGIELSGGSFIALARAVKAIIVDDRLIADLEATAGQLTDALAAHHGQRIRGLDEVLAAAVEVGQGRVDRALAALRAVTSDAGDTANRKLRAIKAASALVGELATVSAVPDGDVSWVEGPKHAPRLRIAPIDVAPTLEALWGNVTAVLTSATIPARCRFVSAFLPTIMSSSMSAARSTTAPTRCCIARPISPTRAPTGTRRRCTPSSRRSSWRPAVARWPCSPAGGRSTSAAAAARAAAFGPRWTAVRPAQSRRW